MTARTLLVPAIEEIPADLETPVSAFLKLQPLGARFLLESVEGGSSTIGRYSFIGPSCRDSFTATSEIARWRIFSNAGSQRLEGRDPLALLQEILSGYAVAGQDPGLPPLTGGAVGHVAYDYVRQLERIGRAANPDPLGLPLLSFHVVDELVVFDHVRRKLMLIALSPEGGPSPRERLARLREALEGDLPLAARPRRGAATPAQAPPVFAPTLAREDFERQVGIAQEHIRAGDIFQVVLSHRLEAAGTVDPFQVYRSLRMLNPSPYMFYFDFGGWQMAGSSPEVLVKLTGRSAVIRPIAGTRPRGADLAADTRLAEELLADPKERAEHLMLVDLARNDIGRVSEYGSVVVDPYFTIERYSHVMHIASGVTGRLREGTNAFDLFRASFPAGTVSGAPKVRAMQIIDALETVARGPYAGAVGYFGLSGDMDTAIVIRTLFFTGGAGGKIAIQAGAGIVHDSDPAREYEETRNKMRALEVAVARTRELG